MERWAEIYEKHHGLFNDLFNSNIEIKGSEPFFHSYNIIGENQTKVVGAGTITIGASKNCVVISSLFRHRQ